jgi:hypothetical protein
MDTNEYDALAWELHLVKILSSVELCALNQNQLTRTWYFIWINSLKNLWVFGLQHTKNVDMLIKMWPRTHEDQVNVTESMFLLVTVHAVVGNSAGYFS